MCIGVLGLVVVCVCRLFSSGNVLVVLSSVVSLRMLCWEWVGLFRYMGGFWLSDGMGMGVVCLL